MDFNFTEEQNLLRETIRSFCKKELTDEYVRWMDEEVDYPPQDLWKKIADLGILGIDIPVEYGGSGLGLIEKMIVVEEIGKCSTAVALAVGQVLGVGAKVITIAGTDEQKKEYLPKIVGGDLKVSFGFTEPAGGSDVLGMMSTNAVEDGDDYIINGQKIFITGAHVADYINTIAITDREAPKNKRHKAITIFLVDAKSPGVTIKKIKKVSMKACSACEIFYENVRVPKKQILGGLNNAWKNLLPILNPERVWVGGLSLGISEAVLRDAVNYISERTAFGKQIGQFMAIQHMIAEMAVDIELGRNLLYKCAWMNDNKMPFQKEAIMAKLFTSDRAAAHAANGMEMLGGYGVCMEYNMQRYLRDARQATFAPINNELCKNIIAESYGLPRSY